jgi:hypothetical protein
MHSANTATDYDVRITCTASKKLTIDAEIDTVSASNKLIFKTVDYRDWIYPVGSIFTWYDTTDNPATKLGLGTWELHAFEGRDLQLFPKSSNNNFPTQVTISVTSRRFHGSAWIQSNGASSNQSFNTFWGVFGGSRNDWSIKSVRHPDNTQLVNIPDAGRLEDVPGDWMYFRADDRSTTYLLDPIVEFDKTLTKSEMTNVYNKLMTFTGDREIISRSWMRTA